MRGGSAHSDEGSLPHLEHRSSRCFPLPGLVWARGKLRHFEGQRKVAFRLAIASVAMRGSARIVDESPSTSQDALAYSALWKARTRETAAHPGLAAAPDEEDSTT